MQRSCKNSLVNCEMVSRTIAFSKAFKSKDNEVFLAQLERESWARLKTRGENFIPQHSNSSKCSSQLEKLCVSEKCKKKWTGNEHRNAAGNNSWFYMGIKNKWSNFPSDKVTLKMSAVIACELVQQKELSIMGNVQAELSLTSEAHCKPLFSFKPCSWGQHTSHRRLEESLERLVCLWMEKTGFSVTFIIKRAPISRRLQRNMRVMSERVKWSCSCRWD